MLSRNAINDIWSCRDVFFSIPYITTVIMGIVEIFMVLLDFSRLNYYEVAGNL